MLESRETKKIRKISLFIFITVLFISTPTHAQYSGGTGEPNDPYQIAEPNDWVELMNTSADWDKNFIMTADIDVNGLSLTPVGTSSSKFFTGVFDGKNHIISNTNINMPDSDKVGLFGYVGKNGQINSIGVENIQISGNYNVGGLVGYNMYGDITNCYSSGAVDGNYYAGGLVGYNWRGDLTNCYSSGTVSGNENVGGLVGYNLAGRITNCYSTDTVSGSEDVGGLVGYNRGAVINCYSNSTVSGDDSYVGGLVGYNYGDVSNCYSSGAVGGDNYVDGLVGRNFGDVNDCFWDIETSNTLDGVGNMDPDPNGVVGKTTAEMQMRGTFTDAGWDFVGEITNGPNDVWKIVEGLTYPLLSWQKYSGGSGEPNDPYLIYAAEQMNTIGTEPNDWDKHFKLMADIDMSAYQGTSYNIIGTAYYDFTNGYANFITVPFKGVFNGDNHTISNLSYNWYETSRVGLFGCINDPDAEIKNLILIDPNINAGVGDEVGAIVGIMERGTILNCQVISGNISGDGDIGGLVGYSGGTILQSSSSANVSGNSMTGGLIGRISGEVYECFSSGNVQAYHRVGGLIGHLSSSKCIVENCYTKVNVSGDNQVGGLIGWIYIGALQNCYSTGIVSGMNNTDIGGLIGYNEYGSVQDCFWDTQTSGWTTSAGGTSKTTTEMQNQNNFTNAGWDFIGETNNGSDDIWWINEGVDYPRLRWELSTEN